MIAMDIRLLVQVEFEVFGHVQGCNFTKCCKDLCLQSGIRGWVKNSKAGTIVGTMQGPQEEIDKVVQWLAHTGSPGCQIERCNLNKVSQLLNYGYSDFSIRF